jgi:hypothetical protein
VTFDSLRALRVVWRAARSVPRSDGRPPLAEEAWPWLVSAGGAERISAEIADELERSGVESTVEFYSGEGS